MTLKEQIKSAVEQILAQHLLNGHEPHGAVDVQVRLFTGTTPLDEPISVALTAEILERADGSWTIEDIT